MPYIRCSNCGEIIEVPPELVLEPDQAVVSGEILGGEPYFCDACEPNDLPEGYDDYDDDEYCDLCGGEGIIITCCDDICVGGGASRVQRGE